MTRLRWLAFGLAILIFAADFVLVRFMLGSGVVSQTLIPGLADFSPTFNRGVSFSLLVQDSAVGRELLISLLGVIVIAVAVMTWRTSAPISSIGFAMILGGALGNLSDRLFFDGAVFDFLAMHLGKVPLFVCNFADIAISIGVVLLVADSVVAKYGTGDLAE